MVRDAALAALLLTMRFHQPAPSLVRLVGRLEDPFATLAKENRGLGYLFISYVETNILTNVPISVHNPNIPLIRGTPSAEGTHESGAGAVLRAGRYGPLPDGSGIILPALRPAREVLAGLGQVRPRCHDAEEPRAAPPRKGTDGPHAPARSQEAWPDAEPLG
jgi:hypothetical protein